LNTFELLEHLAQCGASDLHLVPNRPPVLRFNGQLVVDDHLDSLSPGDVEKFFTDIATEEQRSRFSQELELDFAVEPDSIGRFRINVSLQRGTISIAIRSVRKEIPTIDSLGLPETCKTLALRDHGLVLVTGPTGCGKSTTLAAMVEYINVMRERRIVTIEDPIEFLHEDNKCVITQREVGSDTKSFATSLRHALRQDPDVILVGEMRDLDTAATVLAAAETGHLVFTTLHTPSAYQVIDRIISIFPSHQQQEARMQISCTLEGVLYQELISTADGTSRVPATEMMLATDAVRNLIREAKTHQMLTVIQTGSRAGMQTLDQAIIDLHKKGLITSQQCLSACRDIELTRKSIDNSAELLVSTPGGW